MTQPQIQQPAPGTADFQEQVLPRLLDAAFGSDDGWKRYQWAQFYGALVAGATVAFSGLVLVSQLTFGEPRANENVVFPFATGLVGTGLGLVAGACAVNLGGKKK